MIEQRHDPQIAHRGIYVGGACSCGEGSVCEACSMCMACGRIDFGLPVTIAGCHFCGNDMVVPVGLSSWWVCDECKKDSGRRRLPFGARR